MQRQSPSYDPSSPSSINFFGKRLVGSTLRETLGVRAIPGEYLATTPSPQTKGDFGKLIERYYFGINPPNEPCSPDFKQAGVELKTGALVKRTKGLASKERLVLQMINYGQLIGESFETSCFMSKSRSMMLISTLYQKDSNIIDARIGFADLVNFDDLPAVDREIIRDDWEAIAAKVRGGEAHLLSGSDTTYLEACTKGVDGAARVSQPNNSASARPRALALKAGYVTSLIRGHVAADEQLVVTDPQEVVEDGFEASVLKRFDRHFQAEVGAIARDVGFGEMPKGKGAYARLARAIMGVSTRTIAEFERASIMMKTVMFYDSGLPREHMSFPAFRYVGEGSVLEEEWDSADDSTGARIQQTLEENRFLFVTFRNSHGVITLDRVRFWSMPKQDIEAYVRPVREATRRAIRSGAIQNLPGQSFNDVCHIRPHARDRQDTLPTLRNGPQVKRSFWLDRRYIAAQIGAPID